jgi:hypothetical protein
MTPIDAKPGFQDTDRSADRAFLRHLTDGAARHLTNAR